MVSISMQGDSSLLPSQSNPKRRFRKKAYIWHNRILCVAALLLILQITGIIHLGELFVNTADDTHSSYNTLTDPVSQSHNGRRLLSTNGSNNTTERGGPVWERCDFENANTPYAWLPLYAFIIFFIFVGIAIICDDFFVPSLEAISEKLDLSEDVAGATFMAAGSSAPELFTSVAGVGTDSDVGVGTIVGSAMFNILVILALSSILAGQTLHLDWRPLFRDSVVYACSIALFIGFSWDGKMEWWEALILLLVYISYIVLMKFNPHLMKLLAKFECSWCRNQSRVEVVEKQSESSNITTKSTDQAEGSEPEHRSAHSMDSHGHHDDDAAHSNDSHGRQDDVHSNDSHGHHDDAHSNDSHGHQDDAHSNDSHGHQDDAHSNDSHGHHDDAHRKDSHGHHDDAHTTDYSHGLHGDARSKEFHEQHKHRFVHSHRGELAGTFANRRRSTTTHEDAHQSNISHPDRKEHYKIGRIPLPFIQSNTEYEHEHSKGTDEEDGVKSKTSTATEEETEETVLVLIPYLPPVRCTPPDVQQARDGGVIGWIKFILKCLLFVISFPFAVAYSWTIPDCSKNKTWYVVVLSFTMSIVWIAVTSFALVTIVARTGCILEIDAFTMGLVVIAVGTSIPDCISSILVARDGFGNMAVSNAIGSNVFDINLGLGLPFLIAISIKGGAPFLLVSQEILDEFAAGEFALIPHAKFGFLLMFILILSVSTLAIFRFRLSKGTGVCFLLIYALFLVYAFLQELLPGCEMGKKC